MPKSVESLRYIKCYAILSDTTVRRSAVDRQDLKPYWKSEKRPHFPRGSTILLFTSFSKTLLTTERRLTGRQFLAVDLSPTFLYTGTTDETFQQSGKQDSFRQLFKSLASMYESSGSQFFRTTTIQSGPDAFDESRFVITFLTILGVMNILCSFRLVLEEKTRKEIPESSRFEFLEKFLANNFALLDADDNTSGSLNRGGIADLPLLRTILAIRQKSREPSFWEVMDSFVLVAYASLAASRTLLPRLLACLNFALDSDLFCWYKRKK